MAAGFFVTGTDTGVGKTFVSCLLLHAFSVHDKTAVGMKPIAAGCENGRWHDVEWLRAAGNIDVPRELINPYALEAPIAPHIAAAQQGIEIDLEKITAAFQELKNRSDVVVVEGVGGFRVPVNERQDTSDLARSLDLPVVLVVGMRLGCINHALLTAQAIQQAGLSLAGWVANFIDPNCMALDENITTLRQRLNCPLLGIVPFSTIPDMQMLSQQLDISKMI